MKNWFKEHEAFFKGWKFKLGVVLFLIIMIVGIFLGRQFYGYVMASLIFIVFYYFTLQAQREHIISPKEMQQMADDIAHLEEEMAFIAQHIAENPDDLDAKLLLREMEKEIEQLKEALPKK